MNDAAVAEAPVEAPVEPETPPEPQQHTIIDSIMDFGKAMHDLQTVHKLPYDKGIRLIEMILQYDINRRHLAKDEPYVPDGAVPRTPEEIEALLRGIPEPPAETPDEA